MNENTNEIEEERKEEEKEYILVLDIGTTNVRAHVYNKQFERIQNSGRPLVEMFPEPGHVEIDPDELWNSTKEVIGEVIENMGSEEERKRIKHIGVASARSSFLMWNKETSEPVCNIITWQDIRNNEECVKMNKSFALKAVNNVSSLLYFLLRSDRYLLGKMMNFQPYITATKVSWMFKNKPEIRKLYNEKNLCFGLLDTYILFKLTGGKSYFTEYSNICSTGLCDMFTLAPNKIISSMWNYPSDVVPPIKPSIYEFGDCDLFGHKMKIKCMIGDANASLFGQKCFKRGQAKATMGTGLFLCVTTGDHPRCTKFKGIWPQLSWKLDENESATYHTEFLATSFGSIIEWSKRIGWIPDVSNSSNIASKLFYSNSSDDDENDRNKNDELYFVPGFTGLEAPYNDGSSTGTLIGLSHETTSEQIETSLLKAFSLRTNDMLQIVDEELKLKLESLKVDGGVSQNDFVLQCLADLSKIKIERSSNAEQTAYGCGLMTSIAAGWYTQEELSSFQQKEDQEPNTTTTFSSSMSEKRRKFILKKWKNACNRATHYFE